MIKKTYACKNQPEWSKGCIVMVGSNVWHIMACFETHIFQLYKLQICNDEDHVLIFQKMCIKLLLQPDQ